MVDLEALKAITGTEWQEVDIAREPFDPTTEFYETRVDGAPMTLSRVKVFGSWTLWGAAIPTQGIHCPDPAVAVRDIFAIHERRKTARPNLRRLDVGCCYTCANAFHDGMGGVSCNDQQTHEDVSPIHVCDHYRGAK
jgi:hypothetical protein